MCQHQRELNLYRLSRRENDLQTDRRAMGIWVSTPFPYYYHGIWLWDFVYYVSTNFPDRPMTTISVGHPHSSFYLSVRHGVHWSGPSSPLPNHNHTSVDSQDVDDPHPSLPFGSFL